MKHTSERLPWREIETGIWAGCQAGVSVPRHPLEKHSFSIRAIMWEVNTSAGRADSTKTLHNANNAANKNQNTLIGFCCHSRRKTGLNRWFSFHMPGFLSFCSFLPPKYENLVLRLDFLPVWLMETQLRCCQITSPAIQGSLWGQRCSCRALWLSRLSTLIYYDH